MEGNEVMGGEDEGWGRRVVDLFTKATGLCGNT